MPQYLAQSVGVTLSNTADAPPTIVDAVAGLPVTLRIALLVVTLAAMYLIAMKLVFRSQMEDANRHPEAALGLAVALVLAVSGLVGGVLLAPALGGWLGIGAVWVLFLGTAAALVFSAAGHEAQRVLVGGSTAGSR